MPPTRKRASVAGPAASKASRASASKSREGQKLAQTTRKKPNKQAASNKRVVQAASKHTKTRKIEPEEVEDDEVQEEVSESESQASDEENEVESVEASAESEEESEEESTRSYAESQEEDNSSESSNSGSASEEEVEESEEETNQSPPAKIRQRKVAPKSKKSVPVNRSRRSSVSSAEESATAKTRKGRKGAKETVKDSSESEDSSPKVKKGNRGRNGTKLTASEVESSEEEEEEGVSEEEEEEQSASENESAEDEEDDTDDGEGTDGDEEQDDESDDNEDNGDEEDEESEEQNESEEDDDIPKPPAGRKSVPVRQVSTTRRRPSRVASSSNTINNASFPASRTRSKSQSSEAGVRGTEGGLDVGSEVFCKWSGNGEEYPARILKKRVSSEVEGEDEFYVRYLGFDHRLDEWASKERIREAPPGSITAALAAPVPGGPSLSSHHSVQVAPVPSPSPSALSQGVGSGDEAEVHQVKNIHAIELGKYEIETWYYSPYPEEYAKENKLFLCEFCLKYMKKRHTLERHAEKCECRHPPGKEIYREGEVSVFEVDGKKQRIYCQNLCLLSKLFLDHKTLYYDVDPFYFYILTECDEDGAHIVGYFSKEKYSPDGYNLACIMTLPPYQRKGYGSFLISLSYELSKREGVVGSPEKPLSDLGRLGYRSYWSRVILTVLREHRGSDLSINDISKMTAICTDDIVDTLKELKLVRYWKGKHVLVVSQKLIDAYLDSAQGKRFRVIDPDKLTWTCRRSGRVGSGEKGSRL